jgi:alcohol dehydrogenase YqhD (iron-dependent ADH family)
MLPFQYYAPTKVFFGKDTHLKVGEIITQYGYKTILLHYGGGSIVKNGIYDQVTAALKAAGLRVVELGGVQPNPKLSLVREGVKLCKEQGVELVLAVGGGSVIDSAKAIANGAVCDIDPWEFSLKKQVPKSALPVGVILTLAASGSEMSSSCVITNEDGQLKRGFNSETNRPLFSILNPELTYTVSPYQTACGIVDIMMHTLERYFSNCPPTPLTDRIALALLKSVVEAGRAAMENPKDYEARAELMWAGSLSHNDLTSCGRSSYLAVHQLEHEVSGMFDSVAHGAGLAVLFPAWAKVVYPAAPQRFAQYAKEVWGEEDGLEGIQATQNYFTSIGMPSHLSEFGIGEDSFEAMAEKCTAGGTITIGGLMGLNKEKLLEILHLAK